MLSLFDIAVLCGFPHIVRKEKAVNQHGKRGGDDQGGKQLITNALKRLFHMDILSGWILLPLIIVKKAGVVWRLFFKWSKSSPFCQNCGCGKDGGFSNMKDL